MLLEDTLQGLKTVAERSGATSRLRQTWEAARLLVDATAASSPAPLLA